MMNFFWMNDVHPTRTGCVRERERDKAAAINKCTNAGMKMVMVLIQGLLQHILILLCIIVAFSAEAASFLPLLPETTTFQNSNKHHGDQ